MNIEEELKLLQIEKDAIERKIVETFYEHERLPEGEEKQKKAALLEAFYQMGADVKRDIQKVRRGDFS